MKKNPGRDLIGNKAESLILLQKHKYKIPKTFIINTDAFEEYGQNKEKTLEILAKDIEKLPDYNYIVRSSTNIEDSENYSHAGQFLSIPDIRHNKLIEKICSVWDSASKGERTDYQGKAGVESLNVKCAVILQKMISPVLSGVSFSKNPVTGNNEVVIEAVRGSGEDLMQRGMAPMRWRIRKDVVLEGDNKFEYINLVKNVARSTLKLKRIYGRNVDIEWVFDGKDLYYLQLRSITVEKHLDVFSNKMDRKCCQAR
ncbi:MAG: hypothetical protein JW965_08020 [Bacteroidales bacterium]|nr:hypothetical protein [Bacteroidales bacterium]